MRSWRPHALELRSCPSRIAIPSFLPSPARRQSFRGLITYDFGMKPRRSRTSAYALIHDSNRILLCRLSKEVPRWEGCWTLPGGGLTFGESPEAAVVREVEEETGLIVEVGSVAAIDSLHDPSGSEDFHGIRIIYHVDVIGGRLRHETSGSTNCCAWHQLHPTPEIALVDLAAVGIRIAQKVWSPLHSQAEHCPQATAPTSIPKSPLDSASPAA